MAVLDNRWEENLSVERRGGGKSLILPLFKGGELTEHCCITLAIPAYTGLCLAHGSTGCTTAEYRAELLYSTNRGGGGEPHQHTGIHTILENEVLSH